MKLETFEKLTKQYCRNASFFTSPDVPLGLTPAQSFALRNLTSKELANLIGDIANRFPRHIALGFLPVIYKIKELRN